MSFTLCMVGKLNCHRTPFSLAAIPTHATAMAMHFPANGGLIFLNDELTNDRYLVDTDSFLKNLKIPNCGPASEARELKKGVNVRT